MLATSGNLNATFPLPDQACRDYLAQFQAIYYPPSATAPTGTIAEGALWYNTTTNETMVYNGTSWVKWISNNTVTSTNIVSSLPLTANIGDMCINVVDGAIYMYSIVPPATTGSWVVIARGGTTATVIPSTPVDPTVPVDPNAPIDPPVITQIPPTTTTITTVDPVTGGTTVTVETYDPNTGDTTIVETTTPVSGPPTVTTTVIDGAKPSVNIQAVITQVSQLPTTFQANGIVYNTTDGVYYSFVGGVWKPMIAPKALGSTVGIEVVTSLPTTGLYEGYVVFNTANNKLMKYSTGIWVEVIQPTGAAAAVADGTLTTAKFAAGLTLIEIVSTLPTSGNFVGRTVYLTTSGQLHRYNGTAFVNSVPTTALTGTITATQVGPNAITTGALSVGAVTADIIAANAITASKLAVDSVTSGAIQAGAVTASEIATGAIIAGKIAAGAITASNIAALSIDATKIAAGAITADKMAANSVAAGSIVAGTITSSKLAANSVTATQIATGSITSDHIGAASITATKIQTGSITVDKLKSSETLINGVKFGLGNGSSIAGYTGGGYFSSSSPTTFGLLISNGCGSSNGVGGGTALGVGTVGGPPAASFVNSTSSTYITNYTSVHLASYTIAAQIYNGGQAKGADIGTTNHAVYLRGPVGPFTGSHDALFDKNEEAIVGDIIVDTDTVVLKSVNDAITKVTTSTVAKEKGAVGIISQVMDGHIPEAMGIVVTDAHGKSDFVIDPIHTHIFSNSNIIQINSVGEGGINVCSEGGNIAIGDYICTSSIRGKGMKQGDDIMHSYTVAKSRQNVDWSQESSTTKMIACIYHCG